MWVGGCVDAREDGAVQAARRELVKSTKVKTSCDGPWRGVWCGVGLPYWDCVVFGVEGSLEEGRDEMRVDGASIAAAVGVPGVPDWQAMLRLRERLIGSSKPLVSS